MITFIGLKQPLHKSIGLVLGPSIFVIMLLLDAHPVSYTHLRAHETDS